MPNSLSNAHKLLLRNKLDGLYRQYSREFLYSDPLSFVHRYSNPKDQEVVAWIASVLSYGSVPQIKRSMTFVFSNMSENPYIYLRDFSLTSISEDFQAFRHRFTTGADLIVLFYLIHNVIEDFGSVGTFFQKIFDESENSVKNLLSKVIRRLRGMDFSPVESFYRPEKFWYLLPSPHSGSACKRWNMFLRWMVRRNDGVDLGLWTGIPAAALILPLDTHTTRLVRLLGLTHLKNPSWKMAEEVAAHLRELDPSDPVKYDFALSRLGILKKCPGKKQVAVCEKCPLFEVCAA